MSNSTTGTNTRRRVSLSSSANANNAPENTNEQPRVARKRVSKITEEARRRSGTSSASTSALTSESEPLYSESDVSSDSSSPRSRSRASKPRTPKPPPSTTAPVDKKMFKPLTPALKKRISDEAHLEVYNITTIRNFEQNMEMFRIILDNYIYIVRGFIESEENILFIFQYDKEYQRWGPIADNLQTIGEMLYHTPLFFSDDYMGTQNRKQVYFLFYVDARTMYYIFRYDFEEDADKEFVPHLEYKPIGFLNGLFSTTRAISQSRLRTEVTNIINEIWVLLKTGSDLRTPFIILALQCIKHNAVLVEYNNTKYTVQQLCADAMEGAKETPEELYIYENILSDSNVVKEMFINLLRQKQHGALNSDQFDNLTAMINKMFAGDWLNLAFQCVFDIYKDIYLPFKDDCDDLNKVAFEIENQWNNRGTYSIVAKKGQIFTHKMVKDLIIRIFSANIKNDSTCYDPTCGTGGFTESFYHYCEKNGLKDVVAYGNEFDEDVASMAWLAGICSDIDVRIFNGCCFRPEIKESRLIPPNSIDFLMMNPPYAMGSKKSAMKGVIGQNVIWDGEDRAHLEKLKPTEWTFCRYNLSSFVKLGGWFAFLIPISCVSENKQNNYDKEWMIRNTEIWYIIKVNEKIFQPQAGKASVIVLGRYTPGRSHESITTWKTKCVDFSDDGGKVKEKKGILEYDKNELDKIIRERILDNKDIEGAYYDHAIPESYLDSILYDETITAGHPYYEERVLTHTMNWIYTKRDEAALNINNQRLAFLEYLEQRRHAFMTSNIHKLELDKVFGEENEWCEWRDVKITDLFDIMGRGKRLAREGSKEQSGAYPLIGASGQKNGIIGFVDTNDFGNTDDELNITVAGDGNGAGTCFCQKGGFSAVADVLVLKMKKEIEDKMMNKLMNEIIEDMRRENEGKGKSPADIETEAKIRAQERMEQLMTSMSYMMTEQLTKVYNWSNKCSQQRLMQESVRLPFDNRTGELNMEATNQYDGTIIEKQLRTVKVSELFEYFGKGKINSMKNENEGIYPCISTSAFNNGCSKYIDHYDYDTDELGFTLISVPGDGDIYRCFVQHGKFSAQTSVHLLKLKPEYKYLEECLGVLAFTMSLHFGDGTYEYHKGKLNKQRLMNEEIPNIPFIQDLRDKNNWIIDVSGLKYMYL